MKSTQSSCPPSGAVEITNTDLVRFLMFFAGLWLKTNLNLKAGRALLAAICLRLASLRKGKGQVQLQDEDLLPPVRNPLELVVAARAVFAGMTDLEFPPFILKVIKEMEAEANALLSYYLLAVHPEEEPCG